MISRTSVSVDDATRDVLQELSAHMDSEPVWVGQLRRSIEESLRESIDDGIVPLQNSLEQISRAINATSRQISLAIEELNDQQAALKYIKEEALVHKTSMSDITGSLNNLTTSIIEVNNNLNHHRTGLTSIEQQIQQSHSEFSDARSETDMVLRETLILLKSLSSELSSQRQELTEVCSRVEKLSLPWWRKIFKREKRSKS